MRHTNATRVAGNKSHNYALSISFSRDMGLSLFRQHIVMNNLVQTRTVEGLLMLIEKERQGDTVDRTLLKSLLRMLSDLQMYQEAFESKYDKSDLFLLVHFRYIMH